MLTKLCGFTDQQTVLLAVNSGVNFIGFVFYPPSPRNITPKKAQQISAQIPPSIKKIAVIVKATNEEISTIVEFLKPDFLQIHSSDKQRILEIKNYFQIPIIKAFSISTIQDLEDIEDYNKVADLFLFDTKSDKIGGSGLSFDWKIMKTLNTQKSWFLSGGLNIDNIEEAIRISGTKMVDLSSGIEEFKGTKSPNLIKKFMDKIKSIKE